MMKLVEVLVMLTIKQLRKKIDAIDSSIIKKLSVRQKLSIRIGKLKSKSGKKVFDAKREIKLMHLYEALSNQYQLEEDYIKRLFKIIINNSRKMQK
jgi:chorismate mutase